MKAILINVVEKKVQKIDIDEFNLQNSLYGFIGNGCSYIATPVRYDNGDVMFIDDEGYLHENLLGGFYYPDYRTPICGNAVIIGENDEGDSMDCRSTLEEIEQNLKWLGDFDITIAQEQVLSTPPTIISW